MHNEGRTDRLRALGRLAPAATWVALVSSIWWLYLEVFQGLVVQWATDDDHSHGFLVVPLALFFVWERRTTLLAAPVTPNNAGLLLLAAGLVLYTAGQFASELFLTRASLIFVLAGLVLFCLGWLHLRLLAFPLGFLLLMVPLPAIIFNFVTFPLQTLAAQLGETAIAVSGVPVMREGNVLLVPGRALEVAEACSGIRSLMSLVMLATVLGYFTGGSKGTRVLLVVAAVPIAVLVNAARVGGTGLATYWISPAAADGFFHSFSGWAMFIVATAALFACNRIFETARMQLSRAPGPSC